MSRIFDEDERKSSRGKGDTELTLGSGMLLAVFFGLVVLCGLCFGFGYAVGSRGSKGPVFQSQPPAAGPAPQSPANSQEGKPSAGAQPPAAPMQSTDGTEQGMAGGPGTAVGVAPGTATGAVPGTVAATNAAVTTGSPTAGQQVVTPTGSGWHPVQSALPGGTSGMQNPQPISANEVKPAIPGQGSLMVQIAALSDQEDADVLIGALRRRGYAVSAMRNPADNLIHVCLGPFNNRMDANSMRQKLLSDGYNAVVLP
jgi:DedD protein